MIELKSVRFGPGYVQPAGTIMNLDADEEKRLVDAGKAVYVTTPPPARAERTENISRKRPEKR